MLLKVNEMPKAILGIAPFILATTGYLNAAVRFTPSGNDLVVTIDENIVLESTVTYTNDRFFGMSFVNAYSSNPALPHPYHGPVSASLPVVYIEIDGVTNSTSAFLRDTDVNKRCNDQ